MTTLSGIWSKAPVGLKGALWTRIGRRLVGSNPEYVTSNLGISNALEFRVPTSRPDLAFGGPADNLSERSTIALATTLAKSSRSFVDVGANYGIFSAAVSTASNNKLPIIAVEADPNLSRLLADNISRSRLANCSVISGAITKESGNLVFYSNIDDDSSGSITHHFSQTHRVLPVEVKGIPLAEILVEHNIQEALIKIDVEGAGCQVWEGLGCEWKRARWIIYEIIGPEAEARLPETISNETGWDSYYIRDFQLIRTDFADYKYVPPFWNWLFTAVPVDELRLLLANKFEILSSGD
ncbi:MAG: FkbM family methyltransferase [Proteobacteria bacterium]|nr:FkbM family methyltransferase [Pseudomonadota bacterium]